MHELFTFLSPIFTYRLEQARTGQGDLVWLERAFQKLVLNSRSWPWS